MLPRPAFFAELRKHKLLTFLLAHLAIGVIAGITLCVALLVLDVANLRSLIFGSEHWFVGLFLLFGSVCSTFGSMAMGVAVMGLGDWSDHPDRDY